MVNATPNEVVSSIALSAILEIYKIGGTNVPQVKTLSQGGN